MSETLEGMKLKLSGNLESQARENCLVSVIIPTKNRLLLLRETLESLFRQKYSSWEALIVDDGSTDGTKEFVSGLSENDSRFRYLPRKDQPPGASSCRNIGISQARGDYVIFLDSDDLLAPECLEGRLEVMRKGTCDCVVFLTQAFHQKPGDLQLLWNDFNEGDDLDRFLSHDMPWSTTGPMWRREVLERIGPWDGDCESGQDLEFHIRALASGLNYTKVSVVDSFWRESRPDAISHGWGKRANLMNRTEMLGRIGSMLKKRELLPPARRRRLALAYYRNAFVLCPDNRLMLQIWNNGLRYGVVTGWEWFFLMGAEVFFRIARKLHAAALIRLYPESSIRSTHLKISLPVDSTLTPR